MGRSDTIKKGYPDSRQHPRPPNRYAADESDAETVIYDPKPSQEMVAHDDSTCVSGSSSQPRGKNRAPKIHIIFSGKEKRISGQDHYSNRSNDSTSALALTQITPYNDQSNNSVQKYSGTSHGAGSLDIHRSRLEHDNPFALSLQASSPSPPEFRFPEKWFELRERLHKRPATLRENGDSFKPVAMYAFHVWLFDYRCKCPEPAERVAFRADKLYIRLYRFCQIMDKQPPLESQCEPAEKCLDLFETLVDLYPVEMFKPRKKFTDADIKDALDLLDRGQHSNKRWLQLINDLDSFYDGYYIEAKEIANENGTPHKEDELPSRSQRRRWG